MAASNDSITHQPNVLMTMTAGPIYKWREGRQWDCEGVCQLGNDDEWNEWADT